MDSSKKILVIEDEKPLAHALELKLTHEGFGVKVLSNGVGVVDVLKEEKYALVVCDLVMPKVDGFKVLEDIKEAGIKIPVIILTNLSQAEDEKRVMDLGAAGFYIKSNTPIANVIEIIKKKIE